MVKSRIKITVPSLDAIAPAGKFGFVFEFSSDETSGFIIPLISAANSFFFTGASGETVMLSETDVELPFGSIGKNRTASRLLQNAGSVVLWMTSQIRQKQNSRPGQSTEMHVAPARNQLVRAEKGLHGFLATLARRRALDRLRRH
jgi:hypothetical protein